MKTKSNTNIYTRIGEKRDIPYLVNLNKNWYKPNLQDTNNGFLSVIYDDILFETIIANNDILVFVGENKVVGYVLVNTVIITHHINKVKAEFFRQKPEAKNLKIAFSYQILFDKPLQGSGFFYVAKNQYVKHFKQKYDLLVSTVNKENIRSIKAHKNAGWTFIDTSDNYFLIELSLTNERS
jgi:RimJ/RimL family protein N-acetyltransferase